MDKKGHGAGFYMDHPGSSNLAKLMPCVNSITPRSGLEQLKRLVSFEQFLDMMESDT